MLIKKSNKFIEKYNKHTHTYIYTLIFFQRKIQLLFEEGNSDSLFLFWQQII